MDFKHSHHTTCLSPSKAGTRLYLQEGFKGEQKAQPPITQNSSEAEREALLSLANRYKRLKREAKGHISR